MTKYREILRLASLGISQQSIADSCGVSKKTVNRILKRAKELNIQWPVRENDTDAALAAKFFPTAASKDSSRPMPNFEHIRKELLHNDVSKKLLFSLRELNIAIRERLILFNRRPFQNKRRKAAGKVFFLGKKNHIWHRCLLPVLNSATGKPQPFSSIIIYRSMECYTRFFNILVTRKSELLPADEDSLIPKPQGITRGAGYYRR